jgi:single-strand DNA-binding protein
VSGSVNKVTLLGRLGRDPEVRHTNDNRKIVHLSVATEERWKDRASGDDRKRTEWHRVVIFNEGLAGIAERFLTKGAAVYLEGALQTREWQDKKSGETRYTTEIVIKAFRGELVLLGGGSRDGGAGGDPPDDYGSAEAPARGPAQRRPGGMSDRSSVVHGRDIGAGTGSLTDDLDDEIPF